MGRNRNAKNRGLPPNLYIRKGIFFFRDVRTGKEYSVGKNKSLAITEAINANLEIYQPKVPLINRLSNVQKITLHDWLDQYQLIVNRRGLREKTLKDYRSKINLLKANLTNCFIDDITPKIIANFLLNYPKKSMAKLLRSTLNDALNEAIAEGVISTNPVAVTKSPKITIQRARLTFEQFQYAVNNSSEKYRHIFLLAILTGQRIGDIVNFKWKDIVGDRLLVEQSKTGAKIAIPISLKIDRVGVSISDVLTKIERSSEYICDVSIATLRKNFASALPALIDRPTFHEIRSLSARLYEEEKSAEFAKKILGHKSMQMTDRYLDNRRNGYCEL